MRTKEEVIERMGKQMALPVQWQRCIQQAQALGCTDFIEIGPKPVLKSLVRSISRNMSASYEFY